ncbi:MAG: hypothetical protein ACK5LT_07810 [Lachnospirales bacterium]
MEQGTAGIVIDISGAEKVESIKIEEDSRKTGRGNSVYRDVTITYRVANH